MVFTTDAPKEQDKRHGERGRMGQVNPIQDGADNRLAFRFGAVACRPIGHFGNLEGDPACGQNLS